MGYSNQWMGVCAFAAMLLVVDSFAYAEAERKELDWADLEIQMRRNNVTVTPDTYDDRPVLNVSFEHVEWPSIMFLPREGAWDWEDWVVLEIDVFNPSDQMIPVSTRVDNEGAPELSHSITQTVVTMPGEWTAVRTPLRPDATPLWGMFGLPGGEAMPIGSLDPSRVTAFQVFLSRPEQARELRIGGVRLIRGDQASVELPLVDEFGQYRHEDWPGKIHSLEALEAARDAEEAALASAPSIPDMDTLGGWRDGPQLEATGWFRTEKVDGKWWLVTPEGRLFLSLGITCVGTGERTFVEGRDDWFAWLPERDDPAYSPFYTEHGPVPDIAEIAGEQGLTFTFYGANLVRKYGQDWRERWRESTYDRMRAWGFNTIANWSDADVMEGSPVPFTATANATTGVPPLAAGQAYRGGMPDVFDPAFAERVEENTAPIAKRYADNPLCIGFFVDNELLWDDVRAHTLASPVEQPARQFFIGMLQEAYSSIDALNAAWETDAECWDTLNRPASETQAAQADFDAYVYAFAERYYTTIRDVVRRYAPNHLYLGCRFGGTPEESVLQACADYVDVISVNLYFLTLDPGPGAWDLERTLGKPAIVGEFHFGALDRGMFHTGLQPALDQADRAKKYADYVRSMAANPAFVGCHWFQYMDQPVTGRWFDGENFNIGLVTITDTPYPELIEAATEVHGEVYAIRNQAP